MSVLPNEESYPSYSMALIMHRHTSVHPGSAQKEAVRFGTVQDPKNNGSVRFRFQILVLLFGSVPHPKQPVRFGSPVLNRTGVSPS